MKSSLYKFVLLFILFLVNFASAQTESAKGSELYKKGDYDGAIKILRQVDKKDAEFAEASNMLGLAYLKKTNQRKV